MPANDASRHESDGQDATLLMLRSHEARIAELESTAHKSRFKRLTESASASALFLGLVLTFVSLYDAFVTKPEADRINRLSQFNQAVNSAAKLRQEVTQAQSQITDPKLQLAIASAATPQILNNISTARAMLRDLDDRQVGISQLNILFAEAFTAGDLESARSFATRAVNLTNLSPFLRSEALRIQGQFLFATSDAKSGRQSYLDALKILGDSPSTTMARAFDLADLTIKECAIGDCGSAAEDLQALAKLLALPEVTPQGRLQMATTLKSALNDMQNMHCPIPQNLDVVFPTGGAPAIIH